MTVYVLRFDETDNTPIIGVFTSLHVAKSQLPGVTWEEPEQRYREIEPEVILKGRDKRNYYSIEIHHVQQ